MHDGSRVKTPGGLRRVFSKKLPGFLVFLFTLAIGVAFFYFDQTGAVTQYIRSCGSLGVIVAVLIMAGICISPMPSEGLLIVFFKVYGFALGCLYGWIGAILSSVVVFILARWFVAPLMQVAVPDVQLRKIQHWMNTRGSLGLLLVRLLPVPAFIQSYVVGAMPQVSFWAYFWTGAVSIVPYYLGTCLLYLGIKSQMIEWIIGGGILITVVWAGGFLLNKRA